MNLLRLCDLSINPGKPSNEKLVPVVVLDVKLWQSQEKLENIHKVLKIIYKKVKIRGSSGDGSYSYQWHHSIKYDDLCKDRSET